MPDKLSFHCNCVIYLVILYFNQLLAKPLIEFMFSSLQNSGY